MLWVLAIAFPPYPEFAMSITNIDARGSVFYNVDGDMRIIHASDGNGLFFLSYLIFMLICISPQFLAILLRGKSIIRAFDGLNAEIF